MPPTMTAAGLMRPANGRLEASHSSTGTQPAASKNVYAAPGSATSPTASLTDLPAVLAKVREAGLPVEFEVSGAPSVLAPGIELTAFRIIQEALTNTLRHSAATHARVTIAYEPGYVTLSVTDSGPRRAEPPASSGTGFGLAGIAERVASCRGSLTVGPSPGDGFALTARLPVR
jgi:signal transduction histidine kinase